MRQRKPKSYLSEIDVLPPFLCYAVARFGLDGRRPITKEMIARRTGWGINTKITRIISLLTFSTVTLADADLFRAACGINRHNEWQHLAFLKKAMATPGGLECVRRRGGRAMFEFKKRWNLWKNQ